MTLKPLQKDKPLLWKPAARISQFIQTQSWARQAVIWFAVLAFGLLLLSGRYEWSADPTHARIGYFCSAYFFLIFTPALYYLCVSLFGRTRLALAVVSIWCLVATLPYRWLGLDRFYYPLEEIIADPGFLASSEAFQHQPQWFPQAFQHLPAIPHEALLFFLLLAAGIATASLLYKQHAIQRKYLILGLAAYVLILFQTWMHLSLRSPYLYYTRWDPDFSNQFFISFLFPNAKGAVNRDWSVFRSLELIFMGKAYPYYMLFRRSLYFYISSQFSYFINLYYVSVVFNVVLWAASMLCGYLFTRAHWSERTALLTAGFIATSNGFIMFVAQPMNYLAGYAFIIILVYLFDRLVVQAGAPRASVVLFGALLGLASLNYDLFPFYVYVLGYGLYRKVAWKNLLVIFTITFLIYGGWLMVYTTVYGNQAQTSNVYVFRETLRGIYKWLKVLTLDQVYIRTRELFAQFFLNMGNAFFVIPAVLALLGLPQLKNQTQKVIIFCLFLPAVLLQAVLQLGNVKFASFHIYELPRLYFIVYPGMYILASLFIDEIASLFSSDHRLQKLAPLFPWLCLAVIFVINNIDVWGVPALYYHFYFSSTGALFR
jgi:hypothetical protein